jgi:uncharacterized protein YjbI with pentapeptide repeats
MGFGLFLVPEETFRSWICTLDPVQTKVTIQGRQEFKVTRNADLSNANLARAYFYQANLGGANLSGANLSDANLHGTDLHEVQMQKAIVTSRQLARASILEYAILPDGSEYPSDSYPIP